MCYIWFLKFKIIDRKSLPHSVLRSVRKDFAFCNLFYSIFQMQELKKEIESHKLMFENITRLSEPLFEECKNLNVENGVDEVSQQQDDFLSRWNGLRVFVEQKDAAIEQVQNTVENVVKELKPVQGLINDVEKFVSNPIRFGDNVEKGEEFLAKSEVGIFYLLQSNAVGKLKSLRPGFVSFDRLCNQINTFFRNLKSCWRIINKLC